MSIATACVSSVNTGEVNNHVADFKRFKGDYLVFRKASPNSGLQVRVGGRAIPRFRHSTFESAEAECYRLQSLFPESTFVIIQEVARLKRIEVTNG